ncbi:hypothetical protein [Pelagicoccus mobilis]|uniref:TonB-dependent receptor plug domain-containing protein n=1 Tax=Pelagicoccus mobilis TaxID=415221 RepID=A0A934RVX7_9BACT|nr:hypothetical protein [Pelagicoccus mobilis]MBK1877802.1 hypothetical protein [Pelagicoccus mobilis]
MMKYKNLIAISLVPASALLAQEGVDDEDEIFELSPFTVEGAEETGYRATATLAGTRIRTELKDVGSAISVVTEQFLDDMGVTDNTSLLVYTTNTESGGVSGNFAGLGNGENLDEGNSMLRPNNNNRVRGLQAADNTRGYFLTDIPWDNYNTGRIDLQRGPNSMLFGLGSPAGIINATVKGASWEDEGKVDIRFGSWGTQRLSVNLNRVILEDELAIRMAALTEHQKFQQNPAFEDDERLYFALKYQPSFLKSDSASTTITSNFENGSIEANRPRAIPPEDLVTPWFDRLNKLVVNPLEAYNDNPLIPGSGTFVGGHENYTPALDQLTGGVQVVFDDPNSSQQWGPLRIGEINHTTKWGIGSDGLPDEGVGYLPFYRSVSVARYPDYAVQAGLEFSDTLSPFKRESLTDRSIFDFKNNLIDGDNKREWRDFEAFNIALDQSFFNNRLAFQVAYDRQDYGDRSFRPMGANPMIAVDVNTHLASDQTPNPNVGRPYLFSRTRFGTGARQTEREVKQATAVLDIRATDFMDESWLSKMLGRHLFTGFASEQRIEQRDQQWASYLLSREYGEFMGTPKVSQTERELMMMNYLGSDSLLGVNSPRGLNIQPVSALQVPDSSSILLFDSNWNAPSVDPAAEWIRPWDQSNQTQSENPDNYVGWRTMSFDLINGSTVEGGKKSIKDARGDLQEIDSEAFIWQAYLAGGAIVPTYGYRRDTAKGYGLVADGSPDNYTTSLVAADTYLDLTDPSYDFRTEPGNVVEGSSESWSVVLHTAKFLPELPLGSEFSFFYNESSNFQPAAGRIGVFGDPLGAPSGDTTDYGFMVSALQGKMHFKVNIYETLVKDASFDPGNLWVIGAQEARAYRAAKRFEANLNGEPGSKGWWYRPRGGQTAEEALEEQRSHVEGVLGNLLPTEFYEAWGMDLENGWKNSWWLGGSKPVGITSTADTLSEGVEYELSFEPTKNWSILFNASEQTAKNTNIAGSLKEFVAARNAHWNGPAGHTRMWGGGGTQSILSQWNTLFYSKYQLALQQEGTNVAEMRPWRANMVTSYRFTDGRFKGLNVGGSVRWEDKVAIGYPVYTDPSDGVDKFDIDNPYWGPSAEKIDLFASYTMKLGNGIRWRIQGNLRNAFADDKLIPVTVQGDGSPGTFRIPASREWTISNSFTF